MFKHLSRVVCTSLIICAVDLIPLNEIHFIAIQILPHPTLCTYTTVLCSMLRKRHTLKWERERDKDRSLSHRMVRIGPNRSATSFHSNNPTLPHTTPEPASEISRLPNLLHKQLGTESTVA